MRILQRSRLGVATVGLLLLVSTRVFADDATDLQALLDGFLSGVTAAETHDRFWADDLVYTSSRGTRSTKADIMAGFATAEAGSSAAGRTIQQRTCKYRCTEYSDCRFPV